VGAPSLPEQPQSIAGQVLNTAEQRPPCACGVGVRSGANRLIREGLGVGNRSIVMLHVEAKACAKWALVRFGRVRRTQFQLPEHGSACSASCVASSAVEGANLDAERARGDKPGDTLRYRSGNCGRDAVTMLAAAVLRLNAEVA
jgi:hypothetical protein